MIQRLEKWLCTVEGIQRYERFQTDSGTISKAISKNLLRTTTNVRGRGKLKKHQVNFKASP